MSVSFTKVWLVNNKLVVSRTIHGAIELWKEWAKVGDPSVVKAVGNGDVVLENFDALIEEDEK